LLPLRDIYLHHPVLAVQWKFKGKCVAWMRPERDVLPFCLSRM
jgi:hypothetical protein